MAAARARMLVLGREGNSWGSLFSAFRRGAALTPSGGENVRTLHTKSSLRTGAESKDPKHIVSVFVSGAKAQNPMKYVAYAWAIGLPSGILLFLYAKKKVDVRRVDQMKALKRMRDANKGEYTSERYNKSV